MVAMLTTTLFGGAGRVSAMSFLLLAVLYLNYVFVVDGDDGTYAWVILAFRRICLIVTLPALRNLLPNWSCRGRRSYFPRLYS